eukprot:1160859-Pelagomonas_calceolata.AAC.19
MSSFKRHILAFYLPPCETTAEKQQLDAVDADTHHHPPAFGKGCSGACNIVAYSCKDIAMN